MARTEFDQLLHRYLTGQVSEKERIKIEAWLNVMKTEKDIPHFLTKEEENVLFEKINSSIDNVDEIKAFRPKGVRAPLIFFNSPFRIAAAVILLLTISALVWMAVVNYQPTKEIALNAEIEKKILNDGTIVWLHKGSTLSYEERPSQNTRNATLVGEGFFEVAKDPSRPFIISGGGVTVKVLGTSFNIKTNIDGIELKVLTGKVKLSSPNDKAGITVTGNEKINYMNSGSGAIIPLPRIEALSMTESTEYNMSFENMPMSDVLGKIGKKFEVRIYVANPRLNQCRITADLSDQSLDRTFTMLSALLDVNYKIDGNTVTVSGKGCN